MIFLPHSQINLWGRKITFFSMDVGFIEEVQLGHPGASLASFSIETVLSQQLKKRTNRFSSMWRVDLFIQIHRGFNSSSFWKQDWYSICPYIGTNDDVLGLAKFNLSSDSHSHWNQKMLDLDCDPWGTPNWMIHGFQFSSFVRALRFRLLKNDLNQSKLKPMLISYVSDFKQVRMILVLKTFWRLNKRQKFLRLKLTSN